MKFLASSVLAAAIAVFPGSLSAMEVSGAALDASMASGNMDTRNLMNAAKLYKKNNDHGQTTSRNLEGDIAADSVIKYAGCQTVTFDGSDAMAQMGEDMAELAQYGGVIPVKSYVMFDVYAKNNYDGDGENYAKYADPETYLVDLPTYVQTVANFVPEYKEYFCEACADYKDYCKAYQYYDSNQDMAASQDVDYLSCFECRQKGCFKTSNGYYAKEEKQAYDEDSSVWNYRRYNYNEDGEDEEKEERQQQYNYQSYHQDDEEHSYNYQPTYQYNAEDTTTWQWHSSDLDTESLQWLAQASSCMQTGNANIYIGMQCSDDGNLALGAYFDQDCTLYANQFNVGTFLHNQNDYQYATHGLSAMQSFASNGAKCTDPMYMQFQSPANYGQEQYAENQNDNGMEVSVLCSSLLYGGDFGAAMAMGECQSNNGNQKKFNEYGMPYDISADAVYDADSVCSAVVTTLSQDQYGSNGGWNGAYNDSYEGYDPKMISRLTRTGPRALILWLLALVAITGAAYTVWRRKMGGNNGDKEAPLMDEKEPVGSLA